MIDRIEHRFSHIYDLTDQEREQFTKLTNEGRSLFRQWLQIPKGTPSWNGYAYLVTRHFQAASWAAMTLDEEIPGRLAGRIGVFTHEDYRRKGFARFAVDLLLRNVREQAPKAGYVLPPEIFYEQKRAPWMRQIILDAGFDATASDIQ